MISNRDNSLCSPAWSLGFLSPYLLPLFPTFSLLQGHQPIPACQVWPSPGPSHSLQCAPHRLHGFFPLYPCSRHSSRVSRSGRSLQISTLTPSLSVPLTGLFFNSIYLHLILYIFICLLSVDPHRLYAPWTYPCILSTSKSAWQLNVVQ